MHKNWLWYWKLPVICDIKVIKHIFMLPIKQ